MQASEIFDRFKTLNVIVIGDVMIDRYLSGQVERISPEAPVPVIQLQHEDNRLGGAANVALNLQALGCTPYLLSVVGADANGETLRQLLPEHGISEQHIRQICAKLSLPYLRYSQLGPQSDLTNTRVLILDTIGLLAHAYAYGDLAYIGGGFGSGLHNTLEPTAHGLPVFFGPHYHKFPEAVAFVENGGGYVIHDADEFQAGFAQWRTKGAAYQTAVDSLQAYFAQARGATSHILNGIENELPPRVFAAHTEPGR
jgi:hypothetical protein